LNDGRKKKYIEMFGSFTEPYNYPKIAQQIFKKFSGKVTRGPQNKPLHFGVNLDHIKLGLGLE